MNCQKQPFCALYIKQRQKKKKNKASLFMKKAVFLGKNSESLASYQDCLHPLSPLHQHGSKKGEVGCENQVLCY